jgi:hypothetical protein
MGELASWRDHLREILILIRRNEIRFSRNGCLPPRNDHVLQAEVVVFVPSLIFGRRITVQAIHAHEIARAVSIFHKLAKTGVFFFIPISRLALAALLNQSPVAANQRR